MTIINQNARLFVTELGPGESVTHVLEPGRHAWAQILRGTISLNGQTLQAGDGAAISDERELALAGHAAAGELLLFDLP
jgi:redox-sensitive bicupin YhaK (pirin superfamily)